MSGVAGVCECIMRPRREVAASPPSTLDFLNFVNINEMSTAIAKTKGWRYRGDLLKVFGVAIYC